MDGEETNEGGQPVVEVEPDSAPFRAAIARAEAAEAQLKVIEDEKRDAEVVEQQVRSDAMDVIVKSLDIPELASDLLGWVKGEVTPATVDAALKAKGLNFVKPGEQPATEDTLQPEAPEPLANLIPTSKLGQQVADAATGVAGKDLDTDLAEADDAATVIELMNKAGAAVSYT